jgi:peptidoglycan hydrolase CwlO-like protein
MEEVKTAEIREKILYHLEEIHKMQKKVIELYEDIEVLNAEIYKKISNLSYIKMDIEYIEEKIAELEKQLKK